MKLDEKIKEKSEYNLNYKKIENEIDFDKYTEKETLGSKILDFFKVRISAFCHRVSKYFHKS